ncbi:hypothetical protein J2Z21_007212 [Streptomyces griseochromogenes]|uniref:Transposase IS116/IS110/IS902 C-terminal domain-containing protein n=1 Tax=Streptomyces griseochromogenes TaxID=68214 RepID=A0A1B1AYR2_9ACTN|nr:transposase [Streptomyces griseochromogenes]ANP51671.1 hypothetical protein AVL59_20585 [Streptomyces griseochromogenes]MBP2054209.1 hypothetical protein [Streptomyces griseochromogenes]
MRDGKPADVTVPRIWAGVDKGPVTLLTGYQTPAEIRRMGAKRLESWLSNRKVSDAAALARRAVDAAQAQVTALPGEDLGSELVARPARVMMDHREEVTELDARIEARFRQHQDAEVILSLPGMDPTLGAEFIAATGGDLSTFGGPDRLAGFAPAPWDSGSGNLRRHRASPCQGSLTAAEQTRPVCGRAALRNSCSDQHR